MNGTDDTAANAHDNFMWRLQQLTPRPIATWVFIGLNVLVWLLNIATGVSPMSPDPRHLAVWGGNFLPLTIEQPWRLLAATFLHGGLIHLAVNMWSLHDTGQVAERFYGTTQFVLIYLVSGLFGSLASLYFSARTGVAVGASGAIFGVVGSLFAAIFTKAHKLPSAMVAAMKRSMILFTGFSLYMGFVSPHIDNAAHIGGLVAGFVMGWMLAERFDEAEFAHQAVKRAAMAIAASMVLGFVAWNLVPMPAPVR